MKKPSTPDPQLYPARVCSRVFADFTSGVCVWPCWLGETDLEFVARCSSRQQRT